MNKFYLSILIVIAIGFLFPYFLVSKKRISCINIKEKLGLSKSIDEFEDLKKIYQIIKDKKNQNKSQYSALLNFLILSIIMLLLWIILVYLFFLDFLSV